MKTKHFLVSLLYLGLLWIAPAYSAPEPPQLVAISNPPIFKPKSPEEIKTLEDAMAAIITITSKELGLPVVQPLYLHLYKDADAFGAYAGRGGRRLPSDVVQFATAVAEESRFHINMEKTRGRPWSTLIKTLAHEYSHNIEYVLTVQRGSQWVREGFADWVAARVLDSLGWEGYEIAVQRATLEVLRHKGELPSLSDLEESRKWAIWANHPKGAITTYRLALLAVDQLIKRSSLTRMLDYFKSQDFSRSFGLSWSEFDSEFKKSLAQGRATTRKDSIGQKPEWKIGYKWQYAWKALGRSGTLDKEIIREDIFEGVSSYILRVGRNENFYAKDSFGFLAVASKGKPVSKRNPPDQYFSWPLEVGKEWRNTYTRENLAEKSSQASDYSVLIADIEQIKVPAGSFEAFKLEIYGFQNGLMVMERWYSPQAKWFVKERIYLPNGVREEELTSFKVD